MKFDGKIIGWIIALGAVFIIIYVIYDSFKKKGNPDSLEKARQAKADKAALRGEVVDGTMYVNDKTELKEDIKANDNAT